MHNHYLTECFGRSSPARCTGSAKSGYLFDRNESVWLPLIQARQRVDRDARHWFISTEHYVRPHAVLDGPPGGEEG